MKRAELAAMLDHSVLKPESSASDIAGGIDVVRRFQIGFYCVQPCWVRMASNALAASDTRVVSVIGFPHGCDLPAVKAVAALRAVEDGAAEIDMVTNIGALRAGDSRTVAEDIEAVVRSVPGVIVKVILETAALDDAQRREGCRLAVAEGAAFVKTSTGFHPAGGATVTDVRLLRAAVGESVGVKASGGIRTLDDALAMIVAGANRIGTSASAVLLQSL